MLSDSAFSVAPEKRKTQFYRFPTLLLCGGSAQRCRDNVERGCRCTNIPLSNDTEFQSVHGKVAFIKFVSQKRHGRKNKQTKYRTFSPLAARDILAPTMHLVDILFAVHWLFFSWHFFTASNSDYLNRNAFLCYCFLKLLLLLLLWQVILIRSP